MTSLFLSAQVASAVVLILLILLQQRGTGLTSIFGGEGGGIHTERRGAEKVLFILSIIVATIFSLLSAANLFV